MHNSAAQKPEPLPVELTEFEIADLISRTQNGDEDSAVTLILYLKPHIEKILNSRFRMVESKEDTTQEIYIKVLKKLDQYSGTVPLHHWVSRIATNACKDSYKRLMTKKEVRFGDLNLEQAEYLEATIFRTSDDRTKEQFEARDLVEVYLSRLRPEERLIIQLSYLEDLSHREISQQTGWSESLSKVKAFRARKRLRKIILAESIDHRTTASAEPVEALAPRSSYQVAA